MNQGTSAQLISRLMSDAGFRSAVASNPMSALAGYGLSDAEREAFTRLDASSLDSSVHAQRQCGRIGRPASTI